MKCGKTGTWLQGIFCANFYWSMSDFPPCHQMWCGNCYSSSASIKFPVKKKALDEYEDLENPSEREQLQVAWGKKHEPEDEFHYGRNGDHCLVPFECDTCVFVKLQGRLPDITNSVDELLLACIRRVNLDAFWSRSKHTVRGNREKISLSLKFSEAVGLRGLYVVDGPLPSFDHCGYEVAIDTILYSRCPGVHSNEYTQFDTI